MRQKKQLRRGGQVADVLREASAVRHGGRGAPAVRERGMSEAPHLWIPGPAAAVLRPPRGKRERGTVGASFFFFFFFVRRVLLPVGDGEVPVFFAVFLYNGGRERNEMRNKSDDHGCCAPTLRTLNEFANKKYNIVKKQSKKHEIDNCMGIFFQDINKRRRTSKSKSRYLY